MVARHGDKFALALKADDAAAIKAQHKRIVFMSIENAQPVEADLTLIKTFYDLGVRMIGVAHFKTNDLGDSATDAPEWHGLSPKGRQLVEEANRLGMVLDASIRPTTCSTNCCSIPRPRSSCRIPAPRPCSIIRATSTTDGSRPSPPRAG